MLTNRIMLATIRRDILRPLGIYFRPAIFSARDTKYYKWYNGGIVHQILNLRVMVVYVTMATFLMTLLI